MSSAEHDVLRLLTATPVVGIVRATTPEVARDRVLALVAGGLTVVEVSLTTPGAVEVVAEVVDAVRGSDVAVGIGTAMTPAHVRDAAAAGATFVVSPHLDEEVLRAVTSRDLAAFPGCLTPSEMVRATQLGAAAAKIFPADLWSPQALTGLLEPLPTLRCIPTGGVDASNAARWLDAGAFALGVAGSLATDDPRAAAEQLLAAVASRRNAP
jgi:2-dehydro-3-deoxyphosphogluconate aldolase/(4S)-4-hydroxy-2-oxoglutarate aldolase